MNSDAGLTCNTSGQILQSMKFITPDLYLGMQPPNDTDDRIALWQQACESKNAHENRIREQLPPGMRSFSQNTLHDGIVLKAERPHPDELILEIDGTRNPWGPIGFFRLRFTGVKEVDGIDSLVGDDWLYAEVHLHPQAGFEYRVLFWRSDFRVVADEIQIESMPDETPSAWAARGKKK
jgi:hypothetical protein